MTDEILNWLLEDSNPEVKLRTMKEYLGLSDDNNRVIQAKEELLNSKIYARTLNKLKKDNKWSKFDAIMAFAEWGLLRFDIGKELDNEVWDLIDTYGFQLMCGEPMLLRNLVKLGYYNEPIIKNEIEQKLRLIKEDGGFGCISTNKKMNNPNKPHKSCARFTAVYLMLIAELHLQKISNECEELIKTYFTKRNIFFRTDDMITPMVPVMLETFYPPDPVKVGCHTILYSLKVLGCDLESEPMQVGLKILDQYRLDDGRYILSATKSVPAFKAGVVGEANKWITLYAYLTK